MNSPKIRFFSAWLLSVSSISFHIKFEFNEINVAEFEEMFVVGFASADC